MKGIKFKGDKLNPVLSLITLNANGPKCSIKIQKLSELIL